jgi:hypothetical protein
LTGHFIVEKTKPDDVRRKRNRETRRLSIVLVREDEKNWLLEEAIMIDSIW